jgi:hypothetical protein
MMTDQGISVGDFIESVLRKEILHIWLDRDPAPFDVEAVDALVQAWSPSIAEELLKIAKGWIPSLQLSVDSPLPDLGGTEDDQDVSLVASYLAEPARLTVTESLQSFFGSLCFPTEFPASSVFALRPELVQRLPAWLCSQGFELPSDSVFCLSAEIGPVLLRAPSDEAATVDDAGEGVDEDGRVDIGSVVGSPRGDLPKPPAGSREEQLAKQLQKYQRRIFLLERELMGRNRSEKEKVAYEKAERAKREARLMEINGQLEERLKARTEDLRKTGQKLVEAQRAMNQSKLHLEDKNKQIAKFEYREEIIQKEQDDFQLREKDLSRRLLRLAIQEDTMRQREEFRIDKLRAWLKGEENTESLTEDDAQINMRAALERLEDDFELTFKKRQDKFEAALREYDKRLDDKRNQYNGLHREVSKLEYAHRRRIEAGQGDDIGEQVRTILDMDTESLQELFQSEPQLWRKVNVAMQAFENN